MVFPGGATGSWSSETSSRRTPRSAISSRAEGVTTLPRGTRKSPVSGTSWEVMTFFMHPNRSTIRKDYCNETVPWPVGVSRCLRGGAPHGQFQRKPLQPDRSAAAGSGDPLRTRPGRNPHLPTFATVEAGGGEPTTRTGAPRRRAGAGVGKKSQNHVQRTAPGAELRGRFPGVGQGRRRPAHRTDYGRTAGRRRARKVDL